ncbi:MAG: hypothetical protein WBF84_06690 [Castellaniella sp.]|uniref:hypothetical protein n=1 Tax=Castellaniella sp. TaxID=1955812 RepID=UPI003C70F739
MNSKTQATAADLSAAVHTALGSYPEDIMEQMRRASDTMAWMSDIFRTISDEVRSGRAAGVSMVIIERRASCGEYLADDLADIANAWRGEMERAMDAAGIKRGDAQ